MAREGMIRWKQGDYIRLGRAVAAFNKKVKRLEQEQEGLGLPDLIDYSQVKGEILTRKELNRRVQALKDFSSEGAEALATQTQEPITEWEYKQLSQMRQIAIRKAQAELKVLETPNVQGISPAQMGSSRVSELKGAIKGLENLEKVSGKKFQDLVARIKYFGTSDASMRHAVIFRENYLRVMEEKYSNFSRYDELMEYLYSIKNPLDFYETLKDTSELTSDLYYQSNQTYDEERFSAFVSEVKGTRASGQMKNRREDLRAEYNQENK